MGKKENKGKVSTEQENNEDLINVVKEFLKDTNLKEIIDSFNVSRIEKYNTQKEGGRNILQFWKSRFIKEWAIVLIVLVAILILAYWDKLDNSTLGTLLGSLIGYAVGNHYNSISEKK